MRWIYGAVLVLVFLLVGQSLAWAQSVPIAQIRGVLPQPETGTEEWILVERVGDISATRSARIRDTHGSIKQYDFFLEPNKQWYWLTASVSGIALNNDQDGLILEVDGVEVSDISYTTSRRGEVWTSWNKTGSWIPLAEFLQRWETDDWLISSPTPSPSPSPTPNIQPNATPPPSSAATASAPAETRVSPPSTPYPGRVHALFSTTPTASSPQAEQLLSYQEPDFAAEELAYITWRAWWQRAGLMFLSSAISWGGISLTHMAMRWQKNSRRRWSWPLLS